MVVVVRNSKKEKEEDRSNTCATTTDKQIDKLCDMAEEKGSFGASAPTTPSPSHHHQMMQGNVHVPVGRYQPDGRRGDVLGMADTLCDFNIELLTLVETLRSRVLELERENDRLYSLVKKENNVSEGDDVLIGVLQAEIADLQRQLHVAKVARKSAEATSEALDTKAKLLSDMLASHVSEGA